MRDEIRRADFLALKLKVIIDKEKREWA